MRIQKSDSLPGAAEKVENERADDGHAGGPGFRRFRFRFGGREGETSDLHQCVNMEHIINYGHGPEFAAEPIYLTFFGIENLVLRAGRSSCGFLSNQK